MELRQRGWRLLLKNVFDRICAVLLLVLFSPVIVLVAVLIATGIGPPVLFRQIRPGLHARPFTLIKFRTMTNETDAAGNLLPDEQRLNAIGKVIRSMSLDELPQLWNVLRGDLSLVGPRPLLMEYLDLYTPLESRRHDVMPGITGYTQINGRNELSWDQKFAYDIWYVENWSLALDLKILAKTLVSVFKRDGINQNGHATMPKFTGTKKAST